MARRANFVLFVAKEKLSVRPFLTFFLALWIGAAPVSAQEHEHSMAAGERLGTVHFMTSCNAPAQPKFDRGVALLHSFDFARAIAAFNAAFDADSTCAIAYWGVALSHWGNPFAAGIKPAGQVQQGAAAIGRARAIGASTDRERNYIEAAARLYTGFETIPQGARVLAYRDAMAKLADDYGTDTEASIFYALSLAIAADPADKTYAAQMKAGAILEKLYRKQPDHPGLAHYIIHSYDVPPLAPRALEAARHYAQIAPSAPHALHMPSHTFTRVGLWQESIDTNLASAATAKREGAIAEELHASDYLTYAYLQTGQDRKAEVLLRTLPEIATRFNPSAVTAGAGPSAAFFALAAIPARYALERRAWAETVKLEPRSSPFPYTEAITYFARALGAAQLRETAVAQNAIDKIKEIRERLIEAHETYWAEQVEIQRRAALAWFLLAQRHNTEAIAMMRSAAEGEDATEKNAVTPGPIAPARELLGDMLMELKQPSEAIKEYEAALAKEPNRFRLVYGAAQAASLAGDRGRARSYFQQLVNMCAGADKPERPEIIEARRFLAAE